MIEYVVVPEGSFLCGADVEDHSIVGLLTASISREADPLMRSQKARHLIYCCYVWSRVSLLISPASHVVDSRFRSKSSVVAFNHPSILSIFLSIEISFIIC